MLEREAEASQDRPAALCTQLQSREMASRAGGGQETAGGLDEQAEGYPLSKKATLLPRPFARGGSGEPGNLQKEVAAC